MKKIILLIIALAISFLTIAQDVEIKEKDNKLYLNNSLFTGTQKITKDSHLLSEYTIKEGIKDGKVTHYYPSSKVKEIGFYSSNEKDGKWEKWNTNDKKIAEAQYKNGKKEGSWIVWDSKGVKRYEMFYNNGEKTGAWKVWDDNAVLIQEKQF